MTVPTPDFELPKFDVPKFDVPKFDLPKFDLPDVDLSKFEVPTVELPKRAEEALDQARTLVEDARNGASRTVVLLREAIGV